LLKCWLYPNYAFISAEAFLLIVTASIFTVSPFALIFSPTLVYRSLLLWTVYVYKKALSEIPKSSLKTESNDIENTVELKSGDAEISCPISNSANPDGNIQNPNRATSPTESEEPQDGQVQDTNETSTMTENQEPETEPVSVSETTVSQPTPAETTTVTGTDDSNEFDTELNHEVNFPPLQLIPATIHPSDLEIPQPSIFNPIYEYRIPFAQQPRLPDLLEEDIETETASETGTVTPPETPIPTPSALEVHSSTDHTVHRHVPTPTENFPDDLDWYFDADADPRHDSQSYSSDNDYFQDAEG